METINKAISILNEDKIQNISMLYLLEDNLYNTVEVFDDSVIMRRKNKNGSVYIYSPNEKSFRHNVLPHLKEKDKSFSSVERWIVDILKEKNEIEYINYGQKLILPDDVKIDPPKTKTRPLTIEDAEKADKYWDYRSDHSLEYVKEIITNKLCEGIDDSDELVAWAVTHGDSSLGIMYVMEGHRRKGYAKDITNSMSIKVRKSGRIPFLFVVENNHKSFSLTQKMGFRSVNHIAWLRLK